MIDRREWIQLSAATAAAAATVGASAATAEVPAALRSRAWVVGEQKGVDSLRAVVRTVPPPGPGEALVAVRCAALNHRDLMIAETRYGRAKPPERIAVGDGAGVVLALGPPAGDGPAPAPGPAVKVGDRVTAAHFSRWYTGPFVPSAFERDLGNTADGWLAEHIVLPQAAMVRIPDEVSDHSAAALGAAGITAWTVIATLGQARPGDIVLTLGTGGVAILALQIARLFGARVAITSSSDTKLELARRLGADITVNYRTYPNWAERVLAETGGRGVDIIVETVGLGTLDQSAAACAPNARIGLLGALAAPPEGSSARPWGALIGKNLTLKGITSGSRAQLEELLRAAASNRLVPHVDRSFAFDQAVAAYRHLAAGEHVGKVIVDIAAT